ncbi:WLM-domain-containing protein [Zopfia rhizophila CBS 207.26]|uniref:WLM-domain-containing protein n=1 Tax=Zopfia rhizophila CBS 207.26 TaxID=1314779 RepID=A0A6A6DEJ0_9PEZI|nr:WLM-domain-containing protein [Zopfia rhizophila CBS 207.26]
MPLGFERLNERTQRPNALINFIKPLPGPSSSTAEKVLSRVAAICYPFMKSHMILVQSLEEFPYNNEFVGRNFNAGEVIQLVLKNKRGEWLPETWVMMVMVHELAHCKQMNHSKAFWKVRDAYAADLKALWAKGYTGEGLWGRGRCLDDGEIVAGSVDGDMVPEHLCGGTYGRRRKRKSRGKEKETLTYAERKQRRILKKFGAGGQTLGADDDTKIKLEGGMAKKGKPRVAGSARGRELRAAAALERFNQAKKEKVIIKKEEELSGSETEDEYEEDEAAIDVDGKKIVDGKGHGLIKICEGEDDGENAKREMEEIQDITVGSNRNKPPSKSSVARKASLPPKSKHSTPKATAPSTPEPASSSRVIHLDEIYKRRPELPMPKPTSAQPENTPKPLTECAVCSLVNEQGSLTCTACSNVLLPDFAPSHWRCKSVTCKDSQYINSGDAGICGVCGSSRTG